MESNIKKAAIRLKGIGKADREWILGRLSAAEKSKLMPALKQLDRISFGQIAGLDQLLPPGNPLPQHGGEAQQPFSQYTEEQIHLVLDRSSDIFLSMLVDTNSDSPFPTILQPLGEARKQHLLTLARQRKSPLPVAVISAVEHFLVARMEKVNYGGNL